MSRNDGFNSTRRRKVLIWLERSYAVLEQDPPQQLFRRLRGTHKNQDLTVPVVNNANYFIRQIFPEKQNLADVSEAEKTEFISGSKISLSIYYWLVESIVKYLVLDATSTVQLYTVDPQHITKKLQNAYFHNAVLCLTTEIVAYAFQDCTFLWATLKAHKELFTFDIWIVSEYLLRLKNRLPLPEAVVEYLEEVQELIVQESCFRYHSSFFTYFLHGGGCLHEIEDFTMIKIFLTKFSRIVLQWIETISSRAAEEVDLAKIGFVDHCLDLIDRVLFNHLYLFFDRHIIIPILSSVYCVGKLFSMKLSFHRLYEEAKKIFPSINQSCFQQVLISRTNNTEIVQGTIQDYYNELFLPSCQIEIEEVSDAVLNRNVFS